MSVDPKVLDMPVDAQDVVGDGQPVALVTAGVAATERANISRWTKQGLEWTRAEGKLAGRRWQRAGSFRCCPSFLELISKTE